VNATNPFVSVKLWSVAHAGLARFVHTSSTQGIFVVPGAGVLTFDTFALLKSGQQTECVSARISSGDRDESECVEEGLISLW
jgi:hypothetical protein